VSLNKWSRIVQGFENDLLPSFKAVLEMDDTLRNQMVVYVEKCLNPQFESTQYERERKALRMVSQDAILHSNLAMVAYNLVAKANALLKKHGVMAELQFTLRELDFYSKTKQMVQNTLKLPTANKFTVEDDDEN
jgi:hypothetical protein